MVEANKATLSNPVEMGSGQFASIDTLRIKVETLPLLSKNIIIKEIILVKPQLNLVVDGKGQTNWSFAGTSKGVENNQTPGGKSQVSINKIELQPVRIKNGKVVYLDERSGSTFVAQKLNLVVAMKSLDGPVDLKGSMVWNGEKIELAMFARAPMELATRGSPLDLSVVSKYLGFQFDGRARLENGLSLAGQTSVKTPSIRKLSGWVGSPLSPGKGLEAFSAKAAIDLTGKTIALKKAKFSLDGMNGQGDISVSLKGPRPVISAILGLDQINVNTYLSDTKAGAPAKKPAPADQGWSQAPISYSGLHAVDAKLSIATSQIAYKKVKIGKTRLAATLKNGKLDARLKQMAFYDGSATGRIILNGQSKVPTIQTVLNANGIKAFDLLKDFADFKRLEGTGQKQLSLAAAGASQYQMVSTLTGTANLKFTDGVVRGINIRTMIEKVKKSILGGWNKSEKKNTRFSEFSAGFKFANGVAKNDNLKLLAPLLRIAGAGEADLLKKQLDYKVTPKLVSSLEGQGGKGELKGLGVPVIIKGPWSKPKIYPDIKGILKNPKEAFKKLSGILKNRTGKDLGQIRKKLVDGTKGKIKDKVQNAKTKAKDAIKNRLGLKPGEQAPTDRKGKTGKLLKRFLGRKDPAVQ